VKALPYANTSVLLVKLPFREGYKYLWGKTKSTFMYVHWHHLEDADWFFKADSDT
jgi:glycoprotein-N-acetylgalactosamine 3-beta-galactosyltransferase